MMTVTRPASDVGILEALNDRILALQAQGASPSTAGHYRLVIGRLFYYRYCRPRHLLLLRDITPAHITEWLAIRRQQVNHRTIDSNWRVLRAFMNWCVKHGYIDSNPCELVDPPRRLPVFKPDCREDDVRCVLEACPNTPVGIRDKAFILFLLDSGVRLHEALKLKVADLAESIPVQGKGGRWRVVFVEQYTLDVVREYVRAWKLKPGDALWQGRRGALSTDGAKHILVRAGERAGVKLSAHKLRRSCATWMARSGASLEAIRLQLGHADIQTTQGYLAYQLDDVQREHRMFTPVRRL
ncbi:MAG: tyrosine recombinase XerC [Armatimonadota bacterium]|nr:MAG: tyrosine recombinase XerC [Armatimonadota bacterium]